ncbi:hypothetical protein [Alicyclobacillus sp. ALC3]|uniref:hypothetical protein n=1 Tax=Alicyclobacillus sp. ALC3 TaxID=2796143 RepID=UPI002378B2DC|nr:hypothetical protein [Alicyclobacillus sp. ALC3]WDL98565.1 hypothetical protein JC200_07800 [Alicyclobacillus sp. ALC3]
MKIVSTLWGLLVDDGRLAWTLLVFLVLAAIVSRVAHLPFIGALVIWLGLIISMVFSVEHQLRLRLKSK